MTEGWAAVPNWLVRDERVTPNMLALYAVIQSHAGATGTTRLSYATLAREAGVSEATVKRGTKALAALGVLWWEGQMDASRGTKNRTANVYHPLQESDPRRVSREHRPHEGRRPKGTVTSDVSVTLPTEANPQDSNVPDQGGTVTASPALHGDMTVRPDGTEEGVRTVTQTVRTVTQTVGRRTLEEEQIPSSPSTSSRREERSALPDSMYRLAWTPHQNAFWQAADTYPAVDLFAETVAYIESCSKGGYTPSSGRWLKWIAEGERRRAERTSKSEDYSEYLADIKRNYDERHGITE